MARKDKTFDNQELEAYYTKAYQAIDNETENGKLYISYPMVEALRDYEPGKCGNGEDCFAENMILMHGRA